VGGGVVGVSCAYALAKAGAQVQLLERNEIGSGASGGNAGTVAVGHPPLNRRGRLKQVLSSLLDQESPLYIPPRWDPNLWRWLRDFVRYCTDEHVEECMKVMAPLGKKALQSFDDIIEEEAIECGYIRSGYYKVCVTEPGLVSARNEAAAIEAYGYHPECISSEELRRREPEFSSELLGGIHYPESRSLNPLKFLKALTESARLRGARISEGVSVLSMSIISGRVVGLRTNEGEVGADAVVLATGPFSAGILNEVGIQLPLQPGKGYHRDYSLGLGGAPPIKVACELSEASVFCTPMGDFVRFAGTMEFSGLNRVMRTPRLDQLTNAARRCFPGLGSDGPKSEWCGLRPMASDGMPIIGSIQDIKGLSVATGHGMLGLTLGPVTGEMIAREILDADEPQLKKLSPSRFRESTLVNTKNP
ncbi:MAG: FAD-dependent oxidoreductase, partial [bacterium]